MVASAVVALIGSRLQHARKRLDRREERPNAVSECRVCAKLFHALGLNFSEACTPDSQECDSVLGILRVSPGTQYLGTLTLWSQMERIQHMYYNCAEDAYTARIEAWARTTQELHLLPCTTDMSHWRQKPRMFVPTPAGINSLLFASFVGLDGNAMTGADVLSQWQVDVATFPHVMLAVRVPLPLGMLMVRNAIMQVMILGSWRCARRLFLEWPDQRLFQYRHARETSNSIAQGSDALQDAAAVSEKLRRAADTIRAAAPALLEPAQDDAAQQHGRRVDLESHVTFLDQLSDALAPRSWRPGEQAGLDRWTPSMMISMVLEAQLLKSQSNLRHCLLQAVNTIAPPPPHCCVRH